MGSSLPNAEKTRTRTGRIMRSIKRALVRPETWKRALNILSIALKILKVIAKMREMFE